MPVGSLNNTSVAGPGSKNKLTNGTFRYGALEGISNTTYWQDPGSIYTDHNIPLMSLAGDVNAATGDPAMRLSALVPWRHVEQGVNGLAPGQALTLSGWVQSAGLQAGLGVYFLDASGATIPPIGQTYAQYNGTGQWQRLQATCVVPPNTARTVVWVQDQASSPTGYVLFSDLQLEAGAAPTAYAETMGIYYPDYPRADGTITAP